MAAEIASMPAGKASAMLTECHVD